MHTPGRWKAEHSGAGDANVVAYTGWKYKDGLPHFPIIARRLSWGDAHLIAAAPDMFEALKRIDKWLSKHGTAENQGIADEVSNAILKAEKGG